MMWTAVAGGAGGSDGTTLARSLGVAGQRARHNNQPWKGGRDCMPGEAPGQLN